MITEEEQTDLFLGKHSIELMDLLYCINTNLKNNAIPILNNLQNDYNNDFIELILTMVDLKKYYLTYYNENEEG